MYVQDFLNKTFSYLINKLVYREYIQRSADLTSQACFKDWKTIVQDINKRRISLSKLLLKMPFKMKSQGNQK